MTVNYILRLDGREYEGYRNGTPFTLADAWRESRGVAGITILSATGRVVLANAGSMTVRHYTLPERARAVRQSARRARCAFAVTACPYCGNAIHRMDARGGWWHGARHDNGCNIELFAPDHPRLSPTTKGN